MCGIAGVVGTLAGDRALIEAMTRTMGHRGPDDEGYWISANASLGMRRLSIVDIRHGHQPYSNESQTVLVVFNGEIYNHQDLRTQLESRGHHLTSHADGEVIAHLYEEDPEGFMHHLDGMFAIAIIDQGRGRLTLVRDRWGKKPLLYAEVQGNLAFASELRALLKLPHLEACPDDLAIGAYLKLGYIPAPRTCVAGVSQLPAGHMLTAGLDGSRVSTCVWWAPTAAPDGSLTLESAVERTEELLISAVSKRISSERPLGIFLSGGVDSSLIAAAAARVSSAALHTFSISFDDAAYDESKYAEHVARELGTHHTTFHADEWTGMIDQQLDALVDQPFADSSIVPTMMLARLASEHVVVALGGDGGDELFGGYVRYRAMPALQRWQRVPGAFAVARASRRPLTALLGARRSARLHESLTSYPSLQARYLAAMSIDPQHESEIASRAFESAWNAQPGLPDILRSRSVDFRTYLPGDLLFKADTATMAFGLELRSPMLDQELTAFAMTLPPELLYARQGKPVLKALVEKWIPGFDADRPKMGFGIPLATLLASSPKERTPATTDAQAWTSLQLDRWRARWIPDANSEPGTSSPPTLHVVEVIHGLGLGGTERALVRRLRHQPANIRTTIISTSEDLDYFNAELSELADQLIVTAPENRDSTSLITLIRQLQPDVVVSHTPRQTFLLLRSPLASEIPIVVVVHSSVTSSKAFLRPLVGLALSAANRRAALHIAVSREAATGLQCRRARAIQVLALGAELEPAVDMSDPWPTQTRIRLLSLNRLTRLKNLTMLLRAVSAEAKILREAGAFIAIVGDGPERGRLAGLIESLGISDIAGLHRSIVPPTRVLQMADALIVSSTREGGPITVFEALLAGTRVLSTPVGITAEVLPTVAGNLVLADSSSNAMRRGLRDILAHGPLMPPERAQRAHVALQWSSGNMAQSFYDAVLHAIPAKDLR